MQLLRFPHPLTVALLLVTSSLSQVLFPAFGNPLISPGSSIAHTTSENLARDLTFINFDEGSTINSECTRGPKAIPEVEFDRRAVSIGPTTIPKGTSHTPSPQSAIMDWTASYLLVSRERELPCIVYASADTIADVRHKNAHSKYLGQNTGAYDDNTNTVYLPEGWRGKTFAEASMLVHQMVYHFQNLAGLKYECSWERESLAYAAQEQWLRLHETNLWESFGIDRTIFLLSSEYIC